MSVELTMKANYHTHTPRCNHATGSEREYIEQGLKRKLEILGFADHSPQVFDDYVSGFRMRPEQLEDYVMTLRQLREEYAGASRSSSDWRRSIIRNTFPACWT